MKYFVGIDLGTTNSAISTFDGENVRVWKSKRDQSDVTPSAIYVDKRGRRFYGKKAYENSFKQPESCAMLFKRFMGTNTKFKLGGEELTPEECSAEILRELCKNLPDEIRENKDEIGTVITVPAAFNQMQNAATLEAAKLAGLGKVALMQEPVAAIMRVMKDNQGDGKFLIFDLGGGTLDVAIAERISGKVNFLANGGLTMCGGRDLDKILLNKFVVPWLEEIYSLPEDWTSREKYRRLLSTATYMTELAKIELSAASYVKVEGETDFEDDNGEEVYIDVEINRDDYDREIYSKLMKAVETAQATIEKSGLTAADIDKIIFIGGPNNYKPIREKVVAELGIPGSMEVNPMTAVSEGAAIFAESIDWTSQEHERKATRELFKSDVDLGLSFRYESRTPDKKARVAVALEKKIAGCTFEINSNDYDWTSGVMELSDKKIVTVPLNKRGENTFLTAVYDKDGNEVSLANKTIIITRTFANVGALLAPHSIGIEVKEQLDSDVSRLDYLVREGDALPAKGQKKFRAAQRVRAGSDDSINFKMWEGEIEDNVADNRFIGQMKISGTDFDFGAIVEGAEIICNYTIDDAGSVTLEVEIPAIAETFKSGKNFYSRQEGQINHDEMTNQLHRDGKVLLDKVREMGNLVESNADYEKLLRAGEVASAAINADRKNLDREEIQHIVNDLLDAKKFLSVIRKKNLQVFREHELNDLRDYFTESFEKVVAPQEQEQFDRLLNRAQSLTRRNDGAFERIMKQAWRQKINILWRDDAYILAFFNHVKNLYRGRSAEFSKLVTAGESAVAKKNFDEVRRIINEIYGLREFATEKDLTLTANIIRA